MAKTTRTKKVSRTTRKKKSAGKGSRKTSSRAKKKSASKRKAKSKTTAKKTTRKKTTRKKAPTRGKVKKKTTKKSQAKSAGKKKSKRVAPTVVSRKTKPRAAKSAGTPRTILRKKPRSVAEVASAAQMDEKGYVFINGRRVRMISTQGLPMPKKSRPVAEQQPVEEDLAPVKPLKTRLSKKELNHYRNLLLIKRAELFGDLSAMEASALRSSGGDISHMPIHMADIGTDTFDQDFTLGLADAERKQLREIDEALQRIEDKTYGVCHMTGKDIPKARLDAKPWAKYTIEAARIVESQMQR